MLDTYKNIFWHWENAYVSMTIDNNKLYFNDDAKIEDFSFLQKVCETVESWGYKLNIAENCYER